MMHFYIYQLLIKKNVVFVKSMIFKFLTIRKIADFGRNWLKSGGFYNSYGIVTILEKK